MHKIKRIVFDQVVAHVFISHVYYIDTVSVYCANTMSFYSQTSQYCPQCTGAHPIPAITITLIFSLRDRDTSYSDYRHPPNTFKVNLYTYSQIYKWLYWEVGCTLTFLTMILENYCYFNLLSIDLVIFCNIIFE